jgi:hypothetical protein
MYLIAWEIDQNLINNAQINKSDKIQEIGRAVLTSLYPENL